MKRFFSILCVLLMVFSMAACNNNTHKPNDTTSPNNTESSVPVIDPNKDNLISVEDFQTRLMNTAEIKNYTLACTHTLETESNITLFKNDGLKTYQRFIQNIKNNDGAWVLNKNTEQYWDYNTMQTYVTKDGAWVSEAFTATQTPDDMTVRQMLDSIVGPGFYDSLVANLHGFTYDAIKDEYRIADFTLVLDGETMVFEDITLTITGTDLSTFSCKNGTQTLSFEINNLLLTTVNMPA